jgi:hypothetical protein
MGTREKSHEFSNACRAIPQKSSLCTSKNDTKTPVQCLMFYTCKKHGNLMFSSIKVVDRLCSTSVFSWSIPGLVYFLNHHPHLSDRFTISSKA